MAGQIRQYLELFRSELDVLAFQMGFVVYEVELERPHRKRRRNCFGGFWVVVADGGANPGFELGHAEGLGDVVVGSSVEGGDLSVFGVGGGEDDDGDVACFADPDAYGKSVDIGQAEVEHDDVGGGQGGLGDPLFAVGGGDDLVAPGGQPEAKRPQEGGVVIDDEDFGHGGYLLAPLVGASGSVNRKRAPPPGPSSTQMRSPWALTNVSAMARPRPDRPPVSNRT